MRRYESPYHPVPADYVWTKPDDLATYCREFACELLLRDETRTREDRVRLATHCAAVLIRVAETITGSPWDGRSPEIYCRGGGPPSRAFASVIFEAKKSDRRVCIARAAQLVFGDETNDWLHAYREKIGTRLHQASESDDGFFIVLRQLDDIAYQRAQDAGDIAAGRLPMDIGSREGGEEEEPWQDLQRRRAGSALNSVHNSRRKRQKRWWEDETKK